MIALLIVTLALQLCYPFAVVFRERQKAQHSSIDGRQLVFTGSALDLFGKWMKWLGLTIVTLGIYVFWVGPRLQKWIWENTTLASPNAGLTPYPWPAPAPG
jgi:uncharacterized membrane protein YjgN (DUF898 family)